MKNLLKGTILSGIVAFTFTACTDLEVDEQDSFVVEDESGEFTGVEAGNALTTSYGDLRGFGDQANLYALLEVSADQYLIPTRGTDWGDNGIWRTLHQHTWDASHQWVLNTWNNLNANVFRLNQLLDSRSGATTMQTAEGRFLRAYNMYLLLDLWGKAPFREVDEGVDVDPRVLEDAELWDFIMADLQAALADLPDLGPADDNIAASKAAANFLIAKMELNKEAFTGSAGDMNAVVTAVDDIIAAGYSLDPDRGYFEIFENTDDLETIFYTDAGVGNRMWNGLHYFQTTPDQGGGGWNGFSTTAETFALFEGPSDTNAPDSGQEERRGFVPSTGDRPMDSDLEGDRDADEDGDADGTYLGYGFLFGQQYDADGNPLNDRVGNPLIFTADFPGLAGNGEFEGIRILKYHPSRGAFTNHYILFRYADAHLMKAEAILRGASGGDATAMVNELREARGASAASSVDLAYLLDERGRELYTEGWRRNDQIRFGTFANTWSLKDVTETFRVRFPVPAQAIASNPNLIQNDGY